MFSHVKVGDKVRRAMGRPGTIFMELWCTEVDAKFIYCGPPGIGWKFSRKTGAEVDEELGWGEIIEPGVIGTGSYLVKEEPYSRIADIESSNCALEPDERGGGR